MGDQEREEGTQGAAPQVQGAPVPPFIQIITAASCAFGRGEDDEIVVDNLFGLDRDGRVWQWAFADPERTGAAEGWRLLPNTTYQEGAEPPPKRKTR